VKIDLLGNRALSVVRETLGTRSEREAFSPPDGDSKTIELLQKGRTLGCCQLESPAMRHLLSMLNPRSVHRVIQALALIRPAPASIGMKEAFVRRARGMEPTRLPHPSLESLLGDTYGIMLYEDDAMLVGSVLAGISLEEGDRLRKAIKKSRSREDLAKVSRYFLSRAIRNGIPRETAEEIWVQMAKFTEYSFCRSHAAGYGLVAYHEAYLKAHHPAEYMTAAINNVQGIYPKRVYVWEAKRLGVAVLPPCVNLSRAEFTLENGVIRMGLGEIRQLHAKTLHAILEEREREPLRSIPDFLSRVTISLPELENMALAGAFDFTGLSRPHLVWQARSAHGRTRRMPAGQRRLMVAENPCLPSLPDYSPEVKVGYETETTGCPLSAHPAGLARVKAKNNGFSLARDIRDLIGKNVRLLGIIDTARTTVTKNDEPMEFITFEDETDVFDVTLFPRTLRRLRTMLRGPGPYVIEGTVDSQYDAITVTARTIRR
jgi:DNA polymerase III alpha subunit